MKSTSKISGDERRASIIKASQSVFVEKGFNGTTTRELAEAARVSEGFCSSTFRARKPSIRRS